MTKVDDELYIQIRDLEKSGLSKRDAAKSLGVSRTTVQKYWKGGCLPGERRPRQSGPGGVDGGELIEAITEITESESKVYTKKQKLNSASIRRILTEKKGFNVSERTVRRRVKEMERRKPADVADLLLNYTPGDVMQVDWCELKVIVNGVSFKVPLFCAVLAYSFNVFCMLLPNMSFENFIEGHIRAFEYFQGIAKRIFYDNLRTAVLKNWGANAVKQNKFSLFEAHYQFESCFMNRGKGNEKGAVENLCKIAKNNFCTPIPRGSSFKEIQNNMYSKMIIYRNTHKIQTQNESIFERYNREKDLLNPIPLKQFNTSIIEETRVGDNSVVKYKTNWYSVPEEYIGKTVTIKLTPYTIEVWHQGNIIAEHDRAYGLNERILKPIHFLKTLQKKRRGLVNSAALCNYTFSEPITKFTSYIQINERPEILLEIMALQKEVGEEKVDEAVSKALIEENYSLKAIKRILKIHDKVIKPTESSDPIIVPSPDLAKYRF
jgi:transposase